MASTIVLSMSVFYAVVPGFGFGDAQDLRRSVRRELGTEGDNLSKGLSLRCLRDAVVQK
jgi:hypothetical protein